MTDLLTSPSEQATTGPANLSKTISISIDAATGIDYSISDTMTLWEVIGAMFVVGANLVSVNLNNNKEMVNAINTLSGNINVLADFVKKNAQSSAPTDNPMLSALAAEIAKFQK